MEPIRNVWFETQIKRINPRIVFVWKRWPGKEAGAAGVGVHPVVGPLFVRAVTADDQVVVRLMKGHRWVEVPRDRVTPGRWILFERHNGRDIKLVDVCGADAGPIPLDNRTIGLIKGWTDCIEEQARKLAEQFTEHEIDAAAATNNGQDGGPPVPTIIKRTPEQRAWRAQAEDRAGDIAKYEYHRAYSAYQNEPTKANGHRHEAGFSVRDRRAEPKSNLAP